MGSRKDVQIAVSGAGFSGLGMARGLLEAGIDDSVVLEGVAVDAEGAGGLASRR